jgi:hypothetical protein
LIYEWAGPFFFCEGPYVVKMERVLGDPDDEASVGPSYGFPVRLPAIGDQLDGGIGPCLFRSGIEDTGLVGRLDAQRPIAGSVDRACVARFFR